MDNPVNKTASASQGFCIIKLYKTTLIIIKIAKKAGWDGSNLREYRVTKKTTSKKIKLEEPNGKKTAISKKTPAKKATSKESRDCLTIDQTKTVNKTKLTGKKAPCKIARAKIKTNIKYLPVSFLIIISPLSNHKNCFQTLKLNHRGDPGPLVNFRFPA